MNKIRTLWATRIGDEDWQEQLITENPDAIEPARAWAEANGFDRIRIAEIDLDMAPDFTNVLN